MGWSREITETSGFQWCIDTTHSKVFAKLVNAGPSYSARPSHSAAFFEVSDDDASAPRSCRFLVHHGLYGDLVRVFQQSGNLTCTLDWLQLPPTDGITRATLTVA